MNGKKKEGASLKPYLMVVSPTAFEGPRDGGYTRGSERAARLSTRVSRNSNFSTMAEAKKEDGGAPEYKGKVNLVSSEGDKFEVDTKVAAMPSWSRPCSRRTTRTIRTETRQTTRPSRCPTSSRPRQL